MKKAFVVISVILMLVRSNHSIAQTDRIASANSTMAANGRVYLPPDSRTEQELRKITRELSRGDIKAFDKYMAEKYIFTGLNGEVLTKAEFRKDFRPPLESLHESFDHEDFKVVEYGNTAVMSVKVNYTSEIAGQKVTQSYRATDLFMKEAAQWKLLSRHLSVIPDVKVEVTVDPAIYDSYVGQYEFAPNIIYSGLREADKLIVQAPDGTKLELLAVNDTTFYIKGQLAQITFVKDDVGKVNYVNYRLPNGQVVKIKRVK